MDKNGKSRHSVWLSDDVWQEVDAFYKLDNCPTRNEFVEKALRQYCGRLHAERTGAYLPHAGKERLAALDTLTTTAAFDIHIFERI